MNKIRRKELDNLVEQLVSIREILDNLKDDEQDYMDNMPENLQSSERYEKAENAVSDMELALDSIDEVISYIESASE